MKILIITENFYPEGNAPARRLYEHSKEWVKTGNQITVLTGVPNFPNGKIYSGYKNKIYQSERIDGINIKRVWTYFTKNKGIIYRTVDFISFMLSSFISGLFIKKHDRILVSSPQFFQVISGFLISRIRRIPFILEVRDLWPESIVSLGALKENNFIIKILNLIAKYIYRKSMLIFVVTDSFKDYLVNIGIKEEKIFVIKNGFNFDRTLEPNKDVNTIIKEYKIKNDKFIVSYIGTIGMAHGVGTILKTAKLIKNVTFLIIGEGANKKKLVKRAKNQKLTNVIFIDNIDWQEIVNINQIVSANIIHLKKLKLFESVIPSKMFESMALKKPILAGLIGESLSIIKESNSGIQVEPEDELSLLNQILFLKKYPEKLKEFGENGFIYVNKKHNRKILARQMMEIIEL